MKSIFRNFIVFCQNMLRQFIPGIDQSRRDKEIERLNKSYGDVVSKESDLRSCLSYFVRTESYRMLNGWTYSLKPECLRPGRHSLDIPEQTDVRNLNLFVYCPSANFNLFVYCPSIYSSADFFHVYCPSADSFSHLFAVCITI